MGHGTKLRRTPSQLLYTVGQTGGQLSPVFVGFSIFPTINTFIFTRDTWDSGTKGAKYNRHNNKVSHQSVPLLRRAGQLGQRTSEGTPPSQGGVAAASADGVGRTDKQVCSTSPRSASVRAARPHSPRRELRRSAGGHRPRLVLPNVHVRLTHPGQKTATPP